MHSTYNEGEIVAERFVKTFKTKIHKYKTAVQKMFALIFQKILLINTTTHIIELVK